MMLKDEKQMWHLAYKEPSAATEVLSMKKIIIDWLFEVG